VIFSILKEKERVDMQAIFIFKEARRGFNIFQLRTRCQALSQL